MGNECPNRKPGYRAHQMPKQEAGTDEPPPPAPQPQTFSDSIFGKLLSLVEEMDEDDSGVNAEPVDTTAAASSSAEEHQQHPDTDDTKGLDPYDPLAEFFEESKSTGLDPAAGNATKGLAPRWQPEDFGLHPDGSRMKMQKTSSSAKGSVKRFLTEDEADAALGERRPPGMPRMFPIEASGVKDSSKDQKRGLEPQVEDPSRKRILLSTPKQATPQQPVRLLSRAVAEAIAQPLRKGRIVECNEANYKARPLWRAMP